MVNTSVHFSMNKKRRLHYIKSIQVVLKIGLQLRSEFTLLSKVIKGVAPNLPPFCHIC